MLFKKTEEILSIRQPKPFEENMFEKVSRRNLNKMDCDDFDYDNLKTCYNLPQRPSNIFLYRKESMLETNNDYFKRIKHKVL
jgi:hypothetical protein